MRYMSFCDTTHEPYPQEILMLRGEFEASLRAMDENGTHMFPPDSRRNVTFKGWILGDDSGRPLFALGWALRNTVIP